MTLWRLELARLVRTSRGIALLAVYAFFGLLGPMSAAYMPEIFERFATEGMQITFEDPTPLDGIVQFVSNASQLGLLAVIIVAAAALSVDARPEKAAFLRTRVPRASDLVVPRYVVVTVASAVALIVGTAVAVVTTVALLGSLPVGELVVGTVYGILYLAFAIATVAAVAGFVRSQLVAVFVSIVILLALPVLGIVDAISSWLPSALLMAVATLVAGEGAGEYVPAAVVSVVVTVGLVALAIHRAGVRES
jgi:ABC-2 type transport system permease protein